MIIYLIVINILTFIIYGVDKFLAFEHYYRISEKILFLFSIFGGTLGALFAMFFFRHKTLKIKFYVVNILFLILWILLLWKEYIH